MSREILIPAGEVLKTHRISGELLVRFDVPVVISDLSFVFPEIDGLPVPFRVKEMDSLENNTYSLFLEDIDSREKALPLTGCKLYIERKFIEKKGEEFLGLEGYTFLDKFSGKEGEITNVVLIPGNPLIEVQTGSHQYFIPLHQDFILSIDRENREVIVMLPDGIFDG